MYLSGALLLCLFLGSHAFHPGMHFGRFPFGTGFPPGYRSRFGPFARGMHAMRSRTRAGQSSLTPGQSQTQNVQAAPTTTNAQAPGQPMYAQAAAQPGPAPAPRQPMYPPAATQTRSAQAQRQTMYPQAASQSVPGQAPRQPMYAPAAPQPVPAQAPNLPMQANSAPQAMSAQPQRQIMPVQAAPQTTQPIYEPQFVSVEAASQPVPAQSTSQAMPSQAAQPLPQSMLSQPVLSTSQQISSQPTGKLSTQYIFLDQPEYAMESFQDPSVLMLPADIAPANAGVYTDMNGQPGMPQETVYIISQDHPSLKSQSTAGSFKPAHQDTAPVNAMAMNTASSNSPVPVEMPATNIHQVPVDIPTSTINQVDTKATTNNQAPVETPVATSNVALVTTDVTNKQPSAQNSVNVQGVIDQASLKSSVLPSADVQPSQAETPKTNPSHQAGGHADPWENYMRQKYISELDLPHQVAAAMNTRALKTHHIYEMLDVPYIPTMGSASKTGSNSAPMDPLLQMEMAKALDVPMLPPSITSSTNAGSSSSPMDTLMAIKIAQALDYPADLALSSQSTPSGAGASSNSKTGSITNEQSTSSGSQYDPILAMKMAEAMDLPPHMM